MAGVSIIAAETDREAQRLFTSQQQQMVALGRNHPIMLQPPVDDMSSIWTPMEQLGVEHRMRLAIVGGPETVRRQLDEFAALTGVDEIIVTANIYDHQARRRSYGILAEVAGLPK